MQADLLKDFSEKEARYRKEELLWRPKKTRHKPTPGSFKPCLMLSKPMI
jgi:hypothetical protein